MIVGLLYRSAFLSSRFKLPQYSKEDIMTMCGILKQRYQRNNEQIQTSGLIKLLNDNGKVLGIYSASEARKKAGNMGKDMVLVNTNSTPPVCKVTNFRQSIISRFYQEIVLKRQQQLSRKASSVKGLRLSPNLNQKQMALKLKQIIELSQKNSKVRIVMPIKVGMREDGLGKLEWIKSELMNSCYLEQEIAASREEDQDQDVDQRKKDRRVEYYSFMVRARESPLDKRNQQEKNLTPNDAVKHFLKKYYLQDQVQMMDLKSAGRFMVYETDSEIKMPEVEKKEEQLQKEGQQDDMLLREAKARVLNSRLKTLLSLYQ